MTEFWRLAQPGFLLLLLLLPWVYAGSLGRRSSALPYPATDTASSAEALSRAHRRHLLALLRCVGFVLLVWALARPQGGTRHIQREREGIDIMVVADTSYSMNAMDFTVDGKPANRLDAAAQVFRGFIQKREGDRIGVAVFGEVAYTQVPLTTDQGALQEAVRAWRVGMAGGNQTTIGDAIAVATKRLKDLEAQSRVMILLTDGDNTGGSIDPKEAADAAAALGVRIYTIAIGTNGMAPFPRRDPFTGGLRMIQQKVTFDEQALRDLARRTEGAYFNATDTDSLEGVVATIDELEKTTVEVTEFERHHERYRPALLAGLALWTLAFGFGMAYGEAWP
jgi:Ca-activated chloride channel family protein